MVLFLTAIGYLGAILLSQVSLVTAQETVSIAANHPVHVLPGAIPLAPNRQLNMEVTFALRNRRGLERLLKNFRTRRCHTIGIG